MSARASTLLCDRCGARYALASLPRGGRFRCRNCGKTFQLDLEGPEPATGEVRRAAVRAGLEPLTGPVAPAVAEKPATAPRPPAPPAVVPAVAPAVAPAAAYPSSPELDPWKNPPPAPAAAGGDEMLFGRYTIEGELGRGEMGVVYRAIHRESGRKVALKTLLPGVSLGREGGLKFAREARAIQRITHPNVVPLIDHGESYDTKYLVSELADGVTLDKQPASSYADPPVAVRLVATLARALHHAHQQAVLHLDLKPSNVIVGADGTPRLLDFGLTRAVHTPQEHAFQSPTDEVGGRTLHRAPEQLGDDLEHVDARADVWALGTLLYELLTGVPAFSGGSRHDTVREVLDDDPKPPSAMRAEIASDLDVVTLAALEKRPRDRYPSAAAFADDLDRWLAHRPIQARPPSRSRRLARAFRRHRRGVTTTAAAVLLLAAAAGGLAWWYRDPMPGIAAELKAPQPATRTRALTRGFRLLEVGRLGAAQREALVDRAIEALGDPVDAVRAEALEQLTRQPAALPSGTSQRRAAFEAALAANLDPHRSEALREQAFHAIEVSRAQSAEPELTRLATDPESDPAISLRAVQALGVIAGDEALAPLMRVVGLGGNFRVQGMRALSEIMARVTGGAGAGMGTGDSSGAPSGTGVVERARTNRGRGMDPVVAHVLERLDVPPGEDPVLFSLRHGTTDTKLRVMWAICHGHDPRTPNLLPTLFPDDDPLVGRAAAALLVEVGGPIVERKLEEAMSADSSRIRANAAFALGELGSPDALEPLLKAQFRETDTPARAEIVKALGNVGQRSTIPRLIPALDDLNPTVRRYAHDALAKLAKEDAGTTSAEWQEWWDSH